MKIRKSSGAALIAVMMVMAVMMTLGASILNISLFETKQAALEDKKLQAQYLARSGAEATLRALENASNDAKPSGVGSTVYLNNLNQFGNDPSNMIGKFDITITNPDSNTTVITSVGNVQNVKQTVKVTITAVTTQITSPPVSTVSGASLDWYNSNSGQASTGEHQVGPEGVMVMVSDPGLKVVHGTLEYQADSIDFTTNIWNFKYPLTLKSGMLIFNKPIEMNSQGSNEGSLTLKVLQDVGVNRTDKEGKWGRLQYDLQWYYYSDNTQIFSGDEFKDLDKILNTDPNFPESSTKSISTYSIIWS